MVLREVEGSSPGRGEGGVGQDDRGPRASAQTRREVEKSFRRNAAKAQHRVCIRWRFEVNNSFLCSFTAYEKNNFLPAAISMKFPCTNWFSLNYLLVSFLVCFHSPNLDGLQLIESSMPDARILSSSNRLG